MIKTERLCLRRVKKTDWKSLKSIWDDFSSSPYVQYNSPHDTDIAAVQRCAERWAATDGMTEHMFFAVCLESEMIGYIACHIRQDGYEIGYCFHSAYRGKGYAKESIGAAMSYMTTIGVQKIIAGTALANTPSVKMLYSLGFKLVGTEKVSFYEDPEGDDIVFEGGIFEWT